VRRLRPRGAGDLLVLGPGGELLEQEASQVGPRLAEVQVGHRSGPLPHQLEQHDQRFDQCPLADQDPRLVGHAERFGYDGMRSSPAPIRRPAATTSTSRPESGRRRW
jgi:hypothetical protein